MNRPDFNYFNFIAPYLVRLGTEEQQVERNGGNHVDQEPTLEIVDRYLSRMTDDLVVLVDVRCPKVDENVDKEHDINDEIDRR